MMGHWETHPTTPEGQGMQDDLASRISDGSIAVLELLPGDDRFADLSNYVLRGGASRFAPVVKYDEPIRYVLPVGVPGSKLDFGTLILQRTRCAMVWKSDPLRPYRAVVMELGPRTTVSQSAATIRGEAWGRFDLRREGTPDLTFLVPPVASTALPQMLRRVLVDEPRSQARRIEVPALGPEVTEAPVPKAPEAPAPKASEAPKAPAAPAPKAPAALAPAAPPAAPPAKNRPREEAATTPAKVRQTAPKAPVEEDVTILVPPKPVDDELDETRILTSVPSPVRVPTKGTPPATATVPQDSARWTPRGKDAPTPPAALQEEVVFRDSARQAPPTSPGSSPLAQAPVAPHPTTTQEFDPDEVDEDRLRMADTLKGFLTGFGVTVVFGGLFVLGRVVGLI